MSLSQRALAVATLAATLGSAFPVVAVDVSQVAPEVRAVGTTGATSLAALKGKVVYLDFWASWCGPCRQSFPWMNEMQAKYGARGFEVLAINVDAKREDADKFLAQTAATFNIAFDARGETPRAYGIKGMPSSVLIGADGKVLFMHAGFRDDERQTLEAQIAAALPKR
ncbi:MAG: TlpA disulfide reductase family protein [Burkholderiales bacterium]